MQSAEKAIREALDVNEQQRSYASIRGRIEVLRGTYRGQESKKRYLASIKSPRRNIHLCKLLFSSELNLNF
jgi:hypothetical protein